MGAGLLQFTLGLTTGGFISNLGAADSKLKAFLGGMIGLGAIVAGVEKQIEKGAGLKQLSDQTGETAGNLYRIQRGFKAVGLDSSSAATTIFMLNKALGGVNDNGEPTAGIFAQIGLSIDDLKKLNAPQQLLTIGNALNKLDNSSATAAAGKIFGRYNAREFLQLSRNADEFADALRKGGIQAAIFDRYGRTFEKIEITVGALKEKFSSIFLGIAAGIGPALENILKMLNSVDLSKIGAQIGTYITALTQAFREGKFSDLLGDSLKLGFDALLAYAPGIFEKVGFFLLKALETPLTYIQAGMEYALEQGSNFALNSLANNKIFRTLFGHDPVVAAILSQAATMTGSDSFAQILAERKKDGVKFNLGAGETGLDDINSDANARLAAATAQMKDKWKNFGAEVLDFAGRAQQPDVARKASGVKESLGADYKPEHTALEKMGFVFRGGAGTDPQMQTARNTARMVNLLQTISQKIGGDHTGPGNYGTANLPAV